MDLLSNLDTFFTDLYLSIIRTNKDNAYSNLEDLKKKRMSILQPSKDAVIQYISQLSYSKNVQNKLDEELIKYLLKRLNETNDGFEPAILLVALSTLLKMKLEQIIVEILEI